MPGCAMGYFQVLFWPIILSPHGLNLAQAQAVLGFVQDSCHWLTHLEPFCDMTHHGGFPGHFKTTMTFPLFSLCQMNETNTVKKPTKFPFWTPLQNKLFKTKYKLSTLFNFTSSCWTGNNWVGCLRHHIKSEGMTVRFHKETLSL